MGRLALIADTLGESTIASAVRANMKAVLAPWLAGTNADPLKYDPIWGGICSSAGLANGGADFGNGQYNECAPPLWCYALEIMTDLRPTFLLCSFLLRNWVQKRE